jgi:uncharacterized repeat protein (TIGR01451 family)
LWAGRGPALQARQRSEMMRRAGGPAGVPHPNTIYLAWPILTSGAKMPPKRAGARVSICILVTVLMLVQAVPAVIFAGPAPSNQSPALGGTGSGATRSADDWSQFHHDAARTGNTSTPAPGENTTIWEFLTGAPVNASPVVVGDTVYLGSTDGKLYALNSSTGNKVWYARTGGPICAAAAVSGGYVYVGSDDGYLHCYHTSNGTEYFNYSAGSPVRSPILIDGSTVLFGTDNGDVIALGTSGNFLWTNATYAPVRRAPAAEAGQLFVPSGRNLTVFSILNGFLQWGQTFTANVSHVAAASGNVLLATQDGGLYCRNGATGAEVWSNATFSSGSLNCPAISESQLYIGSSGGRMYRVNLSTGIADWNVSAGDPVNSSAALANGTVLVGTGAKIMAFNPGGSELWSRAIAGGVVSSPALSRSRAFFGTGAGSVVAIGHRPTATIISVEPARAAQGSPVAFSGMSPDCVPVNYQWRSGFDGNLSWNAAFNLSTLSLGTHQISFRVQDSNLTWSAWETASVEVMPSESWPMFHKDSSRRGSGTGDAPLTNTMVWKTFVGGYIYSSPVVYNGMLYMGSRIGGALNVLDVTNGSLKWYYSDSYGGIDATVACADNMTFVGDDAGNLIAFDSDPSDGVDEGIMDMGGTERDIIWSYKIGSIQGSPTVVNGRVLVPSKGEARLYAFDEFKGLPLWNFTLPDPVNNSIWSSPACEDGLVVFGGSNNRLYALDLETGAEVWNFSAMGGIRSSPCIQNETVYFGASDARVYALYLSNGSRKWDIPTGDEITATPAVSNGKVFIGSYDNMFRALDAYTGQEIWKYPTGDKIHSSAAVGGGMVFFASYDGNIYALNETNGKLVWSYYTGSSQLLRSSPALAGGRLYMGLENGWVVAFGKAPDLYVPATGINLSVPAPDVGDEVTVTAKVQNIGTLNATAKARISDGLPGVEIAIRNIIVPAGASVEISGNWTVGPGEHRIVVNVTDTMPYEANTANNLAFKLYTPPAQPGWTMFKANQERTSVRSNISTPNSNTTAWTVETGATTYSSPVTSGNRVYMASGTDLLCIDKRNGTVIWRYPVGSEVRSVPAVSNYVVFGCADGSIRAVNEWDGALMWTVPTGGAVTSSPLLVSEMVYVGSGDGYLYAISLYDGQLRWNTPLGGPVVSSPAYDPSSEEIVVGSHAPVGMGRITALHQLNGTETWNFSTPMPVLSSPAVAGGIAYVGCDDGIVYALEMGSDGNDKGVQDPAGSAYDLLWSTNLSAYPRGDNFMIRSSPAVTADGIFVGVGYNTLVALTLSGAHLWHRDLGTPTADRYIMSSPAVCEERMFVGADGLYAINTRNGAMIWSHSTGDWVWSSPSISVESGNLSRGLVLSVSESGRLQAFSSSVLLPPIAIITSPASGQNLRVGEIVLFNGSASWDTDGRIMEWNWSFGDGNFSGAESVFHNYSEPGEYCVTLTVRDDKGLEGTAAVTVSVRENSPPLLRFPLVSPEEGGDVETVFTLKVTYSDPDNDTAAFVRVRTRDETIPLAASDPSDLNTADGKDYQCDTVLFSGIYDVLFEASDGVLLNRTSGATNFTVTNRSVFSSQDTIFADIFYAGRGDVRFVSSIVSHEPNTGWEKIHETGEFNLSVVNIDKWWWANITVNFSTFNLNSVNRSTLRIFKWNDTTRWTLCDNAGIDPARNITFCNITSFGVFTVLAQPPINHRPAAKLSKVSQTIMEGESVTFNASGSYDPDGDPLKFYWEFGDSTNKTPRPGDKIAEHKFTKAGRYIVTLTVSDDKGLNDTATMEVIVKQKGADQTLFIIIIIIVLVVAIIFVLPRGKEASEADEIEHAPPPKGTRGARGKEDGEEE